MQLRASGLVCTFSRWRSIAVALAFLAAPAAGGAATITVGPGANLQAAIDAAQPGDTILLTAGATYVGNFVLPLKGGATDITIRTAPDLRQPKPGRRIDPIAHAGLLAIIRSGNTLPAIQTDAGAHHWRLELLEFAATTDGYGEIIRLGRGGVDQSTLASVPYEIVIDRCFIHGDPLQGQKRGISLNSASTTIRDSYISDMKGVGFDTQAIAGWNGPGPYIIENNYLEGAGENVLFGGADAKIADLVPSDITFKGNYLFKPRAWEQPIIPAPTASAVSLASGGSLAAGTYGYRVVARRYVGQSILGTSLPSAEATATLAAAGGVRITWAPVEAAREYRVYGRTAGGQTVYWTVTTTSFVDNGAAGTAGTPPTSGTRWTVKNIFELKNARRVLAEGNVFENSWRDGQTGVGVVFTPRNQDGTAPWSTVQDVTFRYNIVRHVGAGININGYDNNYPCQQTRNVLIEDNLFDDVRSEPGTTGRFMQIGSGPANVTVNHNTSIQASTLLYIYARRADGTYETALGFSFTNNLGLHNAYGIQGENAGGYGLASIRAYFIDEWRVNRNALAGGVASKYPAGNFFPDVATFYAQFEDGSYRLRADSPYKGAGSDARDLGADIDTVTALTDRAISGSTTPNQPPTALTNGPYSVTTLTNLTFDGAASWDPDGTLVSYTWSWSDGTPDTSGAAVTHQFAQSGTYTITLTVTDDDGATATTTTSATVIDRAPIANAGGPYTGKQGQSVAMSGAGSSDLDGAIASYRWNWGDGSSEVTAGTPSAAHVYAAGGDYTVTLTVTDNSGLSSSDRAAVSIAKPLEIVVYPAELPASALHGSWTPAADSSAAGGAKLVTPDAGYASTTAPLAAPVHYFDVTFQAVAGVDYRVWLRMSAQANSKWNDSVWVQFSGVVDGAGASLYPIGTNKALDVNLASTPSASELNGWGWQNGAYWLNQVTIVRFTTTGAQTLRVQVREDGVQLDQIVLSSGTYFSTAPGTKAGDTHIVAKP